MKIFIHAHYYLPKTLAGAEKFLHEIALYLKDNEHEIIVSIDDDTEYEYEGIKVVSNKKNIIQYYVWADKILTHLLNASAAINLAWYHNKPLYHLLHNNEPTVRLLSVTHNQYIIYNSEALQKELNLNLPSIVCRPYIDLDYWHNDKDHFYNEYVTLVNCAVEKGGLMLQRLAEAMPGTRFLGVKGSYNTQIIQNTVHRNIQFMPPQMDMKVIYDQTRIIIMPSVYESWGMVASEAMASGIPVICADTPGLRENCGDAAIYISGQSVGDYRTAIEHLDQYSFYCETVYEGKKRNKKNSLKTLLEFMEQPGKEAKRQEAKEKEIYEPVKEKAEMPNGKEKKVIEKPGKKPGRPKKKVNG